MCSEVAGSFQHHGVAIGVDRRQIELVGGLGPYRAVFLDLGAHGVG